VRSLFWFILGLFIGLCPQSVVYLQYRHEREYTLQLQEYINDNGLPTPAREDN
jgi:hypothetical protein